MCGIAGIIDYHSKTNSKIKLESMLRSINYRGPDESGIYHSPYATLGNVRLSIIDILGGQQPLSDPSGRFWIVYNGEIFNYKELRKNLEKKGRTFMTQSDTEVLVQLFAVYGKKCLDLLNGQFAFAIWDKQKEELFIARDRIGIRPLYYNIHNGVFSFASEIKALFQQENIIREFRPESISQVCTFWTTITPKTAFKSIYELSPGNYAVYNREGLKTEKYWNLRFENIRSYVSLTDAIERFHELFSDAVRIRLRADVEVAAYLSGGIDSSASVAYIKDIEPGILNTFSIGFEEKDFDESNYQKEAAKYFETTHKSMMCSAKDIAHYFPEVIWHTEIPILRTAPTPMFLLSKLVRENNIKVVITGEGSDEILAGYNIFKEAIIRNFWASRPDSMIRPLLLKKLYPDLPHLKNANPNVLKMFFGYKLDEVNNPFYSHLLRWNNSNHIKKHFSESLKEDLNHYSPLIELAKKLPENFDSWDLLAKSQWLETTIFMSGYLLSSQGDRMVMANSVEGRYPFLDYRLIEFCASLSSDFKLKGLNEKYLLKKLLKNRIPESIIKRPKQPYRAPIKSVFISKDTPEYVRFMLSDTYTKRTGIFNHDSISALLSKIEKTGISSEMDNMVLSSVISTHLLYYQFIENHNEEFQHGQLKNFKIIEDF
ncbi:MAG: asparagine synthase (glutamine-hydrolyzing) [Bacteroidetes bacterium]|nr:asparagine synthase (glutamine-hydrolyzing) [Bacteroidota bacterium]